MDIDRARRLEARFRQGPLPSRDLAIASTVILGESPDESARWLFRLLREEPVEAVIHNVIEVFRNVAGRSPAWVRILTKSVTRKGRCPELLKPRVRTFLRTDKDALANETKSITSMLAHLERVIEDVPGKAPRGEVIVDERKGFLTKARREATVRITTELTDIAHMEDLAALLERCRPPLNRFTLDFTNVDHVYVVGLTTLVTWCGHHRIVPLATNVAASTQRYLERIRFYQAVGSGSRSGMYGVDPEFAMAIESLHDSEPEGIAGRLVKIINGQMELSGAEKSALTVLFAELVENVKRHGGSDVAAYAAAQVYPRRRKLTLCIADAGMGIRKSFMSGSNQDAKQRIQRGESAVQLACAPLVTSKPERHSGYGLYVTSELITRNGGTFRILSDNEAYTRFLTGWRRTDYRKTLRYPWQGTLISMIVDLNRSLSVSDVYKTLPPVPGTELEDFFTDGK